MKKTIIVLLCIIFASCCSKKEEVPPLLKSKIYNFNYLVIIPFNGCIGCTNEAMSLLAEHRNYSSVLFVITDISDLKTVKIELSQIVDFENSLNLLIDKKNSLLSDLEIGIYPIIYELKNKNLSNKEEVENGLKKHLNIN